MTVLPRVRGTSFLVEESSPDDIVIPDDMGADERLLMGAIREFASQEVVPVLDRIEQRDESVIRPLFKKAAELGIFMAEVPEEYGGLGLNVLAIAGMSESRSYLGGLSSTVFAHQGIGTLPLINFGTDDQIERYLHACMNGEMMAAFALTEPGSGSDAMNIRTTAVLSEDGAGYVVNGSKQWITNAGWADLFILFAKVDGKDFTAFLLERNTPGLTVGQHEHLLGLHGSSVCALALDDVHIPVNNVLGTVGKGHKVALCTLNLGRMKMAANCAGTAKKAVQTATEYAITRQQFGQSIGEFGLIQRKLADMAARAYAAESVAYRTAGLVYRAVEALEPSERTSLDAKLGALTEFSAECAMAKVFGSETYNALADETLQIFGGNGFSEDYPAARMYRDSRITRIYEGTSEICRLSVSKAVLKRIAREELAFRTPGPPSSGAEPETGDASALLGDTRGFRDIYAVLLNGLLTRHDGDALLANDKQSQLGDLADIAIELYAAESTVLRVLKLAGRRPGVDTTIAAALATLTVHRAARRIRDAAAEILATLHDGSALRDAMATLDRRLPTPVDLVALRGRVARDVIDRKGNLPHFAGA